MLCIENWFMGRAHKSIEPTTGATQSSMLSIEDWWPLYGRAIKAFKPSFAARGHPRGVPLGTPPSNPLVFYALHRRLGGPLALKGGDMLCIEDCL
jgi:hypothetical protein